MTLRTAALAGIAIALTVAACGGQVDQGAEPEAETVVARAREAMSSRSFSVISCPSCDPPTTVEYAPPDRIKLSHSPGHDASNFNLIVGDRWYVSSRGERWREAVTLELAFMPLGDPRVLLRYAKEPRLQNDETLSGVQHYVVAMRVDPEQLVNEVLREKIASQSAEDEQGLADYEELIGRLRLRFWIDQETFVVSQIEADYPPFADESGEEGTDPPPGIVSFDFEARVEVPADPISLPAEEARRLDDDVKEGVNVIRRALLAYNEELDAYPPHADQDVLSEFLDVSWPINPYTNQPMSQSAAYSPGDFCYEPGLDGERYRFGVYGWDNSLGQTIPGCIPG